MPEHGCIELLKNNLRMSYELAAHFMRYQPGQKQIAAPILLFRAIEVDAIRLHEFREISHYDKPDWGWKALSRGPVQVVSASGSHGSMLYPPHVGALAAVMADPGSD